MNIWSWTYSWGILNFLECADRSSNFDANNNIIYVPILILFHSWGSSTHPSSKGAKLDWIWLMSAHYSEFGEFLLHIFPNDSCFDAGNHVILIHPFDLVHSCDIHWNNSPLLLLLAHQWFSDVCPSSEGNQHNVVLSGCLD